MREPDLSQTRYRLAGVAGAGGMGTVYIVEDAELCRRVAAESAHPALDGPLNPAYRRRQEVP
jgi:hypothetical protein